MVGPKVIGGDGKLQRSCRGFPGVWNLFCRALALDKVFPSWKIFTGYSLSHWQQDDLRPVDILSGCFWLTRRTALKQVGLLDESIFMYGEEMDWCKRFWGHGWKVVFVPSAEAIHYGGASSANAPLRFYVEMQKANLQYWQKHHSGPAVACYFLVTCLHMMVRTTVYLLVKGGPNQHKRERSIAALKWMLFPRHEKADSTSRGVATATRQSKADAPVAQETEL